MNSSTTNTNSPTLWETLTTHASNFYGKASEAIKKQRDSMKAQSSTVAKPAAASMPVSKPAASMPVSKPATTMPVSTSPTLMTPRDTTVYGGKRRKSKKGKHTKKARHTKKAKKSKMHKRKGHKSRSKKTRRKH